MVRVSVNPDCLHCYYISELCQIQTQQQCGLQGGHIPDPLRLKGNDVTLPRLPWLISFRLCFINVALHLDPWQLQLFWQCHGNSVRTKKHLGHYISLSTPFSVFFFCMKNEPRFWSGLSRVQTTNVLSHSSLKQILVHFRQAVHFYFLQYISYLQQWSVE